MRNFVSPARFLAFVLVLATAAPALATKPGDRAADFTLKDRNGKTVKLSSMRGKVVLLDFWASWCAPCKKELPALDALAARLKAAHKNAVILAVNIDKERAHAIAFMRQARIHNVHVVFNPGGSVAGQYKLPTMPTSFVIDQHGIVRLVNRGFRPGDEHKLASRINGLLK